MSDYFTQVMTVEDWNCVPRSALFASLVDGKKVLHIGCVDAPIFDPHNSLHLHLEKHAGELHGYDTSSYEELAKHTNTLLLSSLPKGEQYDLVLVPEVMEHVGNVEGFLRDLNDIDFERIIITVPDADACARRGHWSRDDFTVTEVVHPDHVAWYSPYTLTCAIKRFTTWKIEKLFSINNISIGASCVK